MTSSELQQLSQNKTRVLLFGISPALAAIIYHMLDFHTIVTDIVTEKHTRSNGSDFILLESNDLVLSSEFHPNIVLLGTQTIPEDDQTLIENIAQGGILVFPEFIEKANKAAIASENFFRRIPYQPADYAVSGNHTILKTPLGEILVPVTDAETFREIEGARLFAQHMGIMEDDFYESLLNFGY